MNRSRDDGQVLANAIEEQEWVLPSGALRVLLLLAAKEIEPDEARLTLKRGGFAESDIYDLLVLVDNVQHGRNFSEP